MDFLKVYNFGYNLELEASICGLSLYAGEWWSYMNSKPNIRDCKTEPNLKRVNKKKVRYGWGGIWFSNKMARRRWIFDKCEG